jgi:uridylate kinase
MKYYKDEDFENVSKYFSTVYTADPRHTDAKNYYEFSIKELKNKPWKNKKDNVYLVFSITQRSD